MYDQRIRVASWLTVAILTIGACGGDGTTGAGPDLSGVATVEVTPATGTIGIGGTIQLHAMARDGTGQTVSTSFTWSSLPGSIASVSSNGLVAGESGGVATITATADGRSGTASITVLDPREQAIAAARIEYVDAASADFFIVGLASQEPLPAGTKIAASPPSSPTPTEIALDRDAYFVLVDLVPTGMLPHPFAYLLVDAEDFSVTIEPAFGPPVIDGDRWYNTFEERIGSVDRFEPAVLQAPLKPVRGVVFELEDDPFASPPAGPEGGRGVGFGRSAVVRSLAGGFRAAPASGQRMAVVVSSGRDGFIANTADLMGAFFSAAGFATTRLDSKDYTRNQLADRVRDLADNLGPDDKFVFYVISHAWADDENEDGVLDGPVNNMAYDLGGENEASWSVATTAAGSVADILKDIPAERVNVFVESCGAGGTLARRLLDPRAGTPFEPALGSSVRVYSSSAYDRVCYFSYTPGSPELSVGRYSSFLVDYLTANPLDANDDGALEITEIEMGFAAAHESATARFATEASFDQKPPPVPIFANPVVTVSGPSSISFEHVLGETPCLQPIGGTFTLTNPTNQVVQWSSAELGGPFERIQAQPFSGQIPPGGSVDVGLKFLCNWTEDFETTFEFLFTTADATAQARVAIPVIGDIVDTPGTLTVTTSTAGDELPDEYAVEDVENGKTLGTVGPNGGGDLEGVRPGTYLIRLKPIRDGMEVDNCTSGEGLIREVTVPAGGSTEVDFQVTCTPPVQNLGGYQRTVLGGGGTTVNLVDLGTGDPVYQWPVESGTIIRHLTGMSNGLLLGGERVSGEWRARVRAKEDGTVLDEFFIDVDEIIIQGSACGRFSCVLEVTPNGGGDPQLHLYFWASGLTQFLANGTNGAAFDNGSGVDDGVVYQQLDGQWVSRIALGSAPIPIQGLPFGPAILAHPSVCPLGPSEPDPPEEIAIRVAFSLYPDGSLTNQMIWSMQLVPATGETSDGRTLVDSGEDFRPNCFAFLPVPFLRAPSLQPGPGGYTIVFDNSTGFNFKVQILKDGVVSNLGFAPNGVFYDRSFRFRQSEFPTDP